MQFKAHLDSCNIENFIPMQYKLVLKNGKKSKKLVPAIHNLVFVRSSRAVIDEIKSSVESRLPARYMMNKSKGEPLIVPDNQMEHFIAIASTHHEDIVFLDPTELKLRKGDKVRIIEGPLAGVEGEFLRIRGDRRVVVSVNGLMAVATAFIAPYMLQKIETNDSSCTPAPDVCYAR